MNPIYNVHNDSFFIEIPVANGAEIKIARINWLQLLEEAFYVAGLTFVKNPDSDPYNGCSSEWILQKDVVVGLKAICCNLYWSKDQSDEIKKMHGFWGNDDVFLNDNTLPC